MTRKRAVIETDMRVNRLIWENKLRYEGNNKGIFQGDIYLIICLLNKMTKTEVIERKGLLVSEVSPTE